MTSDELDLIETELGVKLPEQYRQAVDPYPIPVLRGNTDWMLHDLEADGIDPSGTPEEREAVQEKNAKGGCLFLLLVAIVGGVIFSAIMVGWSF